MAEELERDPGSTAEQHDLAAHLREHAATFDRWAECALRPSPVFALHEGPLPGGALAQLIHDPSAEPLRLVVFSLEVLDDQLFSRAWTLFTTDEFLVPETSGRRVVSLMPDLVLRIETAEGVEWMDTGGTPDTRSTSTHVDGLLRGDSEAAVLRVEGVGSVTVLMPSTLPPVRWSE